MKEWLKHVWRIGDRLNTCARCGTTWDGTGEPPAGPCEAK